MKIIFKNIFLNQSNCGSHGHQQLHTGAQLGPGRAKPDWTGWINGIFSFRKS